MKQNKIGLESMVLPSTGHHVGYAQFCQKIPPCSIKAAFFDRFVVETIPHQGLNKFIEWAYVPVWSLITIALIEYNAIKQWGGFA